MGEIPDVVQQSVVSNSGPNGPVPHVPVAGGMDHVVLGQQVMGSISSSLEDWSSKAANLITSKTSEIFVDFEKRQAALKEAEKPTWKEHAWGASKFAGKTAVIFALGLGFIKASAVIVKGVVAGKAAKAPLPAASTMPVTPTY